MLVSVQHGCIAPGAPRWHCLLPLAAMRIAPNSGVNRTFSDFLFAALLLGGVGLAFELAVWSRSYRACPQPCRRDGWT